MLCNHNCEPHPTNEPRHKKLLSFKHSNVSLPAQKYSTSADGQSTYSYLVVGSGLGAGVGAGVGAGTGAGVGATPDFEQDAARQTLPFWATNVNAVASAMPSR